MMKRLYFLFTFLLFTTLILAQNSISGTLLEEGADEPLIGASVFIKGSSKGTTSDLDGKFMLENVANGNYQLIVSYLGFTERTIDVTVDGNIDLGELTLAPEGVGLQEILVVADVAVDRKTPVAVTTLKGEVIEAKIGNQEYPEMLRKTPSVYVTKQGGGFGDARINVRGFTQNNFAVMINGVPVNDMENGWVYWSNWAGLSDVTSRLQYQRGLGATKLAVPTIGGSINIITNPAEFKKGGTASLTYGNDNYLKASASYSTGLSKSGWAATFQASHTRGDGYVNSTAFRAYSYFGALSKTFDNGKHMLSLTALGAPQWHHQRTGADTRFERAMTLRLFNDPDDLGGPELGIKWNPRAGTLDGEEFNWRRNFYHKPKMFLNHYWNISDKLQLKTSAYLSTGRGGGTGPRGRINNARPEDGFFRDRIFDSFTGLGEGVFDNNGQVRFDDIVAYNQGQGVAAFGDENTDPGTTTTNGDGFIRRASMNSHNWYGALSTLTATLNENFTLTAGLDYRNYTGIHYRRVENLLGNTSYVAGSDDNNPNNSITEASPADFGSFSDNSYKDGNNVLNYWNDGLVKWLGGFAQLEFSTDKISSFASISLANQGFKRIDYFSYLDSDPERETDWENFGGGQFKTGINYNFDDKNNVFFNAGYYSKQPLFDNVFINFRNDINPDVTNQSVTSFELGYGYRGSNFNLDFGLYQTIWTDRQFDRAVDLDNEEEGLALFTGVGQTHRGIELEADYQPSRKLGFDFMLSLGDWTYSDDFTASITNTDTGQPAGTETIYANGLKIGDAAQTTASIGINYEFADGLRAYADYTFQGGLYAQYDINDDQFVSPGGQIAQLPNYSLVDAGISYSFNVGGNRSSLRLNINNLFNTTYISESFTNIVDDPATDRNEIYDNLGFWGFGTTWNLGYKVWF